MLGLSPSLRDDGAPRTCGPDNLVWLGWAPLLVQTLGQLGERVAEHLGRQPLVVGDPDLPLAQVAWCTGGAQGMLADAVDAAPAPTSRAKSPNPRCTWRAKPASGFIAAGHHATERYGVQALGTGSGGTFRHQGRIRGHRQSG